MSRKRGGGQTNQNLIGGVRQINFTYSTKINININAPDASDGLPLQKRHVYHKRSKNKRKEILEYYCEKMAAYQG